MSRLKRGDNQRAAAWLHAEKQLHTCDVRVCGARKADAEDLREEVTEKYESRTCLRRRSFVCLKGNNIC